MAAIFIAIPHAAVALPEDLKPAFLPHVDEAFLRTQSDVFTDQVYSIDEVRNARYPWSRFVADPNRAERQTSEGGVVPLLDFDLEPLYAEGGEPSTEECLERIARYHRPYHEDVARAVADPRTRFFVDGHSMASSAPRRSLDHGKHRPDAVVSNRGDDYGNPTPAKPFLTCQPILARFAANRLSHWLTSIPAPRAPNAIKPTGEVWLNDPFRGGYGVRSHSAPNKGLPGIQLELKQGLWCDETCFEPIPDRIEWMRTVMSAWVLDLSAHLEASEPERTRPAPT